MKEMYNRDLAIGDVVLVPSKNSLAISENMYCLVLGDDSVFKIIKRGDKEYPTILKDVELVWKLDESIQQLHSIRSRLMYEYAIFNNKLICEKRSMRDIKPGTVLRIYKKKYVYLGHMNVSKEAYGYSSDLLKGYVYIPYSFIESLSGVKDNLLTKMKKENRNYLIDEFDCTHLYGRLVGDRTVYTRPVIQIYDLMNRSTPIVPKEENILGYIKLYNQNVSEFITPSNNRITLNIIDLDKEEFMF